MPGVASAMARQWLGRRASCAKAALAVIAMASAIQSGLKRIPTPPAVMIAQSQDRSIKTAVNDETLSKAFCPRFSNCDYSTF
jgi:anti-sigma-K factor RskA